MEKRPEVLVPLGPTPDENILFIFVNLADPLIFLVYFYSV